MLSACVITKDEESLLPRLLDTLTCLDDVVVLDTGSTDRTVEVAQAFANVRVEHFVWTGSFSDARNQASREAKNEWLMWLDADMWFEPVELERLLTFLPNVPPEVDGLSLRVVDGAQSLMSLRIYRRSVKFTGTVHESPDCKRSIQTPFAIHHHREEAPGDRACKDARYKELLLAELEMCPTSVHALQYLRDLSFHAKNLEDTKSYCTRMLEAGSTDYLCHYLLGRVALVQQRFENAVDHGFETLRVCCTDPRVPTLIANAYSLLGRKIDALVFYEMALHLPEEAKLMGTKYAVHADDYALVPLVNMAGVLLSVGRKAQAVAAYELALKTNPETPHRAAIEANLEIAHTT